MLRNYCDLALIASFVLLAYAGSGIDWRDWVPIAIGFYTGAGLMQFQNWMNPPPVPKLRAERDPMAD